MFKRAIIVGMLMAWELAAASAKECAKFDLERKDCRLRFGSAQIRLLAARAIYESGPHLFAHDLPLRDSQVEWESARLLSFGQKILLEWRVWDVPKGSSAIQALRWLVMVLDQAESRVLLDEVISRRRAKIKDPQVKTELSWSRGRLHWRAGSRQGEVEFPSEALESSAMKP